MPGKGSPGCEDGEEEGAEHTLGLCRKEKSTGELRAELSLCPSEEATVGALMPWPSPPGLSRAGSFSLRCQREPETTGAAPSAVPSSLEEIPFP